MDQLQPPPSRLPPSAMNPDIINRIIYGRRRRTRSLSLSRGRQHGRSPLGLHEADLSVFEERLEMNAELGSTDRFFDAVTGQDSIALELIDRNTPLQSEASVRNIPEPTGPTTPRLPEPIIRTTRPRSQSFPAYRPWRWIEVLSPLSILERVVVYISSFFESEPDIIEYSNAEIAKRTSIHIKAEWTQCSSLDEAKRMLRIMAIVRNGDWPMQTTEIVARQKRVKEILLNSGVAYLAEDVYKKEIAKSMRKLKRAKECGESVATTQ